MKRALALLLLLASAVHAQNGPPLGLVYPPSITGPTGATGATGAAGAGRVIVYKTANETIDNSSTLQSDDHLTASLSASTKYEFEFRCHVSDASTAQAGGFKAAIGGTATLTNLIASATLFHFGDNTFAASARITAAGQVIQSASVGATLELVIAGTVEINGAGTFLLQWAQSAATDAGDGVSVLRGSSFTYQPIP